MRKIGSLLLQNNYYYSPLGIKISKRDDKVKCCDNSWTLTQPSMNSNQNKGDLDYQFQNQQLRKLEINIELSKFYVDKSQFIHTNIPQRSMSSRNSQIDLKMFNKKGLIEPELIAKKKHVNKLTMGSKAQQQLFYNNGYSYDLDKSLQFKYHRSPSILIKKQHKAITTKHKKQKPLIKYLKNNPKQKYSQSFFSKQIIRTEPPHKKQLTIKIIENFQQGHNRFKTLMDSAARMVGKYRI